MNKLVLKIVNISTSKNQHAHDYAQIIIPLEASVFLQTSASDFIIDPQHIGYIPPAMFHKYRSDKGTSSLIINIPHHLLKKTDDNKLSTSHTLLIDDKLHLLIQLILKEMESNPDSLSLEYLFFFLYDKLIESKIFTSIDYISKHYLDELHIANLAAMEHYNENYYREWFKRQTGLGPTAYIQKLRIEKAKELLVTTKYGITEIAIQVGYDHNSSFTRAFKQTEGINPKEYRLLHR